MKIKLLILSLLIRFFSFGQVPDTETFDLDTVVSIVNPTTSDLVDAFNDTIADYMNRTYYANYFAAFGNKLNLLMFRDYGPHNADTGDSLFCVEYGLLYNYFAIMDSRKISSSDDWVIPTYTSGTTIEKVSTLVTYLGGSSVAGGAMKDTGFVYWQSPNSGATNSTGFNARGAATRSKTTGFTGNFMQQMYFFTRDLNSTPTGNLDNAIMYVLNYTNSSIYPQQNSEYCTYSVRLVYKGVGTPTEYVGNDGHVYRVVTIGTQTWLADNLMETKFRNGDIIPWYGANPSNYFTNAEWSILTTAGVCAYNNDENLVNCDSTFSFPAY